MKIITYATPSHKHYQERTYKWFAERNFFGMEYIKSGPDMLSYNFKLAHAPLLEVAKGAGYWCWKYEILLNAMENMDMGDGIIYVDSNVQFYTDPQPMFWSMKNGDVFITNSGFTNKDWTKRDCFVLMGCDEEKYWTSPICWVGFIGLVKSPMTMELLKEYGYWCSYPAVVTDTASILRPDFPLFIQHRHDQSILTNILIKREIPMVNCLLQNCMYEVD